MGLTAPENTMFFLVVSSKKKGEKKGEAEAKIND